MWRRVCMINNHEFREENAESSLNHHITEREIYLFWKRHKMEFVSAEKERVSAVNGRCSVTTEERRKKWKSSFLLPSSFPWTEWLRADGLQPPFRRDLPNRQRAFLAEGVTLTIRKLVLKRDTRVLRCPFVLVLALTGVCTTSLAWY